MSTTVPPDEESRVECPKCYVLVLEDEFIPAEDGGPGQCLYCLLEEDGW